MSSDFLTLVRQTIIVYFVAAWKALALGVEVLAAIGGIPATSSTGSLRKQVRDAHTYAEWKEYMRRIDVANGYEQWRCEEETKVYNFAGVAQRIQQLSVARNSGNVEELLKLMQLNFHRATFGITNPVLFSKYRSGTKQAIRTYVELLQYLCRSVATETTVDRNYKLTTMMEISRQYGHTALVLQSSAAFGAYHIGVIKGLRKANLLPRIFFGSNTGAVLAAIICCRKDLDVALDLRTFDFSAFNNRGTTGSLKRKLQRWWREGVLMDVEILLQFVRDNLGLITFEEAYKLTGRVLNLHVVRYQGNGVVSSWLLNYATAPQVVVATAAVASCASAGLYGEVQLKAKAMDGSIVAFDPAALTFASAKLCSSHINEPLARLREMFNVQCFIVADATFEHLPFISVRGRSDLLSRVLYFFLEEVWRFLAFATRLKPFRSRLTGFFQTVTHDIEADVLICPISRLSDLINSLRNLDSAWVKHSILRGQQAVWPCLEQIRCHLAVELSLSDALTELLENSVESEQLRAKSGRSERYWNGLGGDG